MSNMVEKGSKYTDEQRTEAAIQFAVLGNMKQVAKRTGIPRSTIIGWKDKDWWTEIVTTALSEKREQHIAKYSRIVDKAQDVTLEKLPECSAAQANLIACQATDKAQLLSGMPTAITTNHDTRALAEICMELSRTMRGHRVVATQEPDQD